MKRKILFGSLIGISIVTFMFVATCTLIGLSVSQKCEVAQDKYAGDCVEALIAYLDDETNSYKSRNSAIWALGQLGDNRALPALRKLYVGKIPPREPADKMISQYSLKKAISLITDEFNITKLVTGNTFPQNR